MLDLGANNGFNSLQLLRNGAKEAIAFEIESEAIEQGIFLKSAYEWSDLQQYNFRYINSNMADLVTMDLEPLRWLWSYAQFTIWKMMKSPHSYAISVQ